MRAQNVPGSADPGRIEQRFHPPIVPKSTNKPIVPIPQDMAKPPHGAAEVTFVLNGLLVKGSTVYKKIDFFPFYEADLGKKVSLTRVFEIVNAITAKYRGDGYVLSRAIVPAQRIREGIVNIQVIEGYIDKVSIEGDRNDLRNLIGTYADKIVQSRPLHIDALERYLLLANDLPGIRVRSLLRPSKSAQGAASLVFMVDYQRVNASVTIDNRGSEFIGPVEGSAMAQGNSLLGLNEKTRLSYVASPNDSGTGEAELHFFNVSHEQIIGSEGTRVGVRLSRSLTHPGGALAIQEVNGRSTSGGLTVSQPWIRSRRKNLQSSFELSFNNSRTDLLGEMLSDDHIRTMRLSTTYDFVDTLGGVSLISGEISKGFSVLGGSKAGDLNLSRANARPDFLKFKLDASRLQRITSNFNILLAMTGQISRDELLASEEFSVGGSKFGRGYDPSEIVGEHGFATKAELQWNGRLDNFVIKNYQLFAFHDFGLVWQKDVSDGDSLASAGLGVRFNLWDWMSGELEISKPLTRSVSSRDSGEGNDPRFYFSLTARY